MLVGKGVSKALCCEHQETLAALTTALSNLTYLSLDELKNSQTAFCSVVLASLTGLQRFELPFCSAATSIGVCTELGSALI